MIIRPSRIHRFCEHSLPSVTKHVAHMILSLIASWRRISLSKLSPGNVTIHYWIIKHRLKIVAVSLNLSFNEVASLVTTNFQVRLVKLKNIIITCKCQTSIAVSHVYCSSIDASSSCTDKISFCR